MPAFLVTYVDRFRDFHGRFASVTNQAAVEHSREHIQNAARIYLAQLQAEAPRGVPDPLGRPKAHKTLAENLSFRTEVHGNGIRVLFLAPPHAKYVIGGTRPHQIPKGGSQAQMAKGYPLHFYWSKLQREVWFWSVFHPGTQPNPFHLRAWARVREEFLTEARRGGLRVLDPVRAFFGS